MKNRTNSCKSLIRNLSLILILFLVFSFSESIGAAGHDYYQVKIFTLSDDTQGERMDQYLKNAYIPAMHRAGISKVGVFKPIEEDTVSGNIIIVWIHFTSLEQFEGIASVLDQDTEYLSAGKDYLEASFDNAPYERINSTLLKAFRNMPQYQAPNFSTPPAERIYELRSYESATERIFEKKVEMFNEGGEMALFEKLEFNAVFYAEAISGGSMPNLMYMTTFSDMTSRGEHWGAFGSHPDWLEMRSLEKYQNTVSSITRYLLHPTDYSDL